MTYTATDYGKSTEFTDINERKSPMRRSPCGARHRRAGITDMSEMRPTQSGGRAPTGGGQNGQSAGSRQRIERARLRERRRRRRRNITLLVCLLLILVVAACAVVAIWFISDPTGEDKLSETTAVTTTAQDTVLSTEATTPETVEAAGPEAYGITFISDLADYEQYMDPAERDDYLILVNKTSTINASDEPTDLIDVTDTRQDGRATQQMRLYAAKALEALFIEMRAYGYTDVSVTSAFRGYNYQEQLFTGYVSKELKSHSGWTQEQAEAEVETYSARPGTSEHQTGLCCDMHNLPGADVSFANKEAYKWLSENAWKFGFILRFPEDKTEITGYSFEPWHYRYVGRYHAQKIHDGGLCLEEYLQSYLSTAASAQKSN